MRRVRSGGVKESCQCFSGGSVVGSGRFDFVESINEGTLCYGLYQYWRWNV